MTTILLLCVAKSFRSQMAEGLARQADQAMGRSRSTIECSDGPPRGYRQIGSTSSGIAV